MDLYVAYTSSNGADKYSSFGNCGYVYDEFPNNTELLRPYVDHTDGGYVFMLGVAYY